MFVLVAKHGLLEISRELGPIKSKTRGGLRWCHVGKHVNLAGSSVLLSAVGGVLIIAVNALSLGALGIIAFEKRGFTFCFK